jgi:DNA repair exonuclease SbcCD nuclease subunit
MRALGVGDLHLDGPLIKYLPNLNELILDEVTKCLRYARDNGIENIFLYGDICHRPNISMDALIRLYQLLATNKDLQFYILKGNHDVLYAQAKTSVSAETIEDGSAHSLRMVQELAGRKHLKNVQVIADGPTDIEIGGETVRFLPWPHTDCSSDALNILHIEISGARYDTGRKVDGATDLSTFQAVAGHLHQAQRIGKVHYSGTLYQTNFGESLPKYFHDISYRNNKLRVKKVENDPYLKLHTVIIESKKDLKKIPTGMNNLCKVYVKRDVVLPEDAFSQLPNVVKINSFKTIQELKVIIQQELQIEDTEFSFNERSYVKDWLKQKKDIPLDERKRAYKLYRRLTNVNIDV